jgi:hypothetical protein
MREKSLTLQQIGLISGTRVALGAGIGMLLADCINKDQRKGAGWTLLGIGVLTTIPLAVSVFSRKPARENPMPLAA